ncbi:cell wall-binding protein [Clostridium beijerinckii]|uniref:Glucan-binding YG repeat protein n=1 Tax=Clostridium beijerinckii TaxID=1520 RepID=A0AAE5EX85_CLOBE|nr:cell wall-binding protein [Clostridium beijerinckii]NSB12609.1 glucan-binding YG repeat protein [Clostridium beijerinckii]OOM29175.1 toxin A [Clostridium beijerinckii]
MKKKMLNKLVAMVLVYGSVLAVGMIPANAAIKTESGKTYYYNELGQKVKGWLNDNGKWYYFNENGEMQKNTTMKIDGEDFEFNENGVLISKNGQETKQALYEYGKNSKIKDGKIYYVNASGKETGWVEVDGKVYYYNNNGEMQKNTTVKDINGKEVKLDEKGVAVGEHGYELIMGEEVTYDSSEAYKKSHEHWRKVGNDWYYYLTGDDMLADSWEQNNGVWYYFNNEGKMQKNTTVKDGKGNDCILNAEGALTNRSKPEIDTSKYKDASSYSWKEINGNWYYMASDGDKVTGWIKTNGKWYYCNKDGVMQKNTTIIEGDNKYVLDASGAWINN